MSDVSPQGIWPQPGPQEAALASRADITIYGGAAGCGKSWALLVEALRYVDRPGFSAVAFRRTYPELTNPGGLWPESKALYRNIPGAEPKETTLEWWFPSGARVKFAHMQHEDDRFAWKGAQIPLIEFDQLESFTEEQFWYMLSRNRDPSGTIRPYIRASCNPTPSDDPIGGWLCRLLEWWIDGDTGLPDWSKSGKFRWFIRDGDVIEWADSPAELVRGRSDVHPKSLTFIPGRLDDNQALLRADPGYRANLLALPLVERERLLGGNWHARPAAGRVFNRAWFQTVEVAPADARRVRAWDKAGTAGRGDYSAGVRMGRLGGLYYIEHVERGQWSSGERNVVMRQHARADGTEVEIWMEQEPGSGGKESAEISVMDLAGYVVHAQTVTGDKLTRARALSAQTEAGNVRLVRGDWNEAFLSELHAFDGSGKGHDDQVDAASLAFNKLALDGGIPIIGDLEAPLRRAQSVRIRVR